MLRATSSIGMDTLARILDATCIGGDVSTISREGGAAQKDDASAQTGEQVSFRIGHVAMPAAALIELLGDHEPLLRSDLGAERLAEQGERLDQERAPSRRPRRPAERGRDRIGGAA